jgi:hypothetical protein
LRSHVSEILEEGRMLPQHTAVQLLISASRALAYSGPLLRERREKGEHREQPTRRVNLWKSKDCGIIAVR